MKIKTDTKIYWKVFTKDHQEVSSGEDKNLITQLGRDAMAEYSMADWMGRLVIGSGTQTLKRTGAGFSQSGTTLSCGSSFFVEADATNRRAFFFADGTACRIVGFTSGTEVTVDRSQTVTSQNGTVFYDELEKLHTFVENINTYVSGSSGTTATNSVDYNYCSIRRWRTFRTSSYLSGLTITELGLTSMVNSGSDPDMNTIANLTEAISIPDDGYADISYEVINILDCSIKAVSEPISGIIEDTTEVLYGNSVFIRIGTGSNVNAISSISSSGVSSNPSELAWLFEPKHSGVTGYIIVDTKSITPLKATPPGATNDYIGSTSISVAFLSDAYVSGTFQVKVRGTLSAFGSTDWSSYGLSTSPAANSSPGYQKRCMFNSPQIFGGEDIVTLVFTKSWEI